MPKRLGYHHTALRVRDIDRTIEFYAKLGCSLVREWGEGEKRACMMDIGGGNLLEIFAGGTGEAEVFPKFEHIALRSEDPDADFEGLFETLDHYGDVYEYIGVGDSMIREALFSRLAEIMGCGYEVVYEQWLAA